MNRAKNSIPNTKKFISTAVTTVPVRRDAKELMAYTARKRTVDSIQDTIISAKSHLRPQPLMNAIMNERRQPSKDGTA